MKPGRLRLSSMTGFLAAFVFLSVLQNFDYPPGDSWSWRLLQPSIDVWLLLILLAIAASCGKLTLRVTVLLVWILFLALRLLRIGDTVVPMYLNRPFNLYIDSGYLFGLYDLLKTTSPQGNFLLMSLSALAIMLGFVALSWYAWQAAACSLADKRLRISVLVVSSLMVGAAFIGRWHPAETPAIVRLGREILSIRHQLEEQQAIVALIKKTIRTRGAEPISLKGLEGADVLLFMVESYGHIVFNRPDYRQAMEATMTGFAEVLDRHGFMAVSSYLVSPTYGGASWLAHATLEFGLRVENDLEKTALLRSSLPPIASSFDKSGYRTVSVMPGTRLAFPEGASYEYEQVYYSWHFEYRGPAFGWAPMPDQFVLDWVRRREFARRDRPFFIRYVLISSHAAFSIQPPLIADWDAIGDGSIYNDRQPVHYPVHWPDLRNAGEAYLRSLDYEFTIFGDYLERYVGSDTLIIIMGDHQPNLQLTGSGRPWSVPVHIISRNPRLLEPFRKRNYTPGLIPAQPLPHAGMETFMPDFLQDFSE